MESQMMYVNVLLYSSVSNLMMLIICIDAKSHLASLHTELASPLSRLV